MPSTLVSQGSDHSFSHDGSGHEFSIGAKLDRKKTDVGVWDDTAGLMLDVSIKTYTFRDYHGPDREHPAHLGRCQRNIKQNEMELRDEADVLHRRQRYAVLFALAFMPADAAWGGVKVHSSFARVVFTFRERAGRRSANDHRKDIFEQVFTGPFEEDGRVGFFDVENPPRRNQPPAQTIPLAELVAAMQAAVVTRNEGGASEDRYQDDDPDWRAPPNNLPEGLGEAGALQSSSG